VEITIQPDEVNRRLDVVLAARTGRSRSQIQAAISGGLVLVNNVASKPGYLLRTGDEVTIVKNTTVATPIDAPLDLPILFQNDDLIVIDKPAGVLVHMGNGRTQEATVASTLSHLVVDTDRERPGIVHRLDRDTSGLLLIARNPEAKAYLQELFASRHITKTYQALLTGRIDPPSATVSLPLGRAIANRTRQVVDPHGRPAVTNYLTLATFPGYSYVEATPATGRTHQLRVHFAALGHPIVGDKAYGAPANPFRLGRQFLHAARLQFTGMHGEPFDFTSPLPPELQTILGRLHQEVY
jgi:23S rRNA pseudouridine1911/1915/1917 synthase